MSYETDSLKKDIKNLEYDLSRKVNDEDFRRKLNQLESRINEVKSNLKNQIESLNIKLDNTIEFNNLNNVQ